MTAYSLTPEQRALQEKVRSLTREKIAPGAEEREEKGDFMWDMVELLAQNDLLRLNAPREYGGLGLGLLELCLTVEEICRACNNTAVVVIYQANGVFLLLKAGDAQQQEKYIPQMCRGERVAGFAMTEPGGGSDVAAIKTAAVRDGDGYLLNGSKRFISSADGVGLFIIFAKTDPEKGGKGISAFLVEADPRKGTPGLSITREKLFSMYASDACWVRIRDLHLPRQALLGEEGEAFKTAMHMFDYSRPMVASRGVGTAQGALDCALDYVRRRTAFGRPIAAFQGIQFMLADMAAQTEAARQLVYMAASHVDAYGENKAMYASMAKMFASDVAMKVTTDAVQILGGVGVTTEYPVARFMKDAKIMQIVEGTNQIQRMIIARHLVGRY